MIFAILFIIAFIVGLIVYLLTNKWLAAVLFSSTLFIVNILSDTDAKDGWGFSLIFGLPIVFVASLLGAYVVELRRGEEQLENGSNVNEGDDQSEAEQ